MENVKIYRNIAKLSHVDLFYYDTKTEGPVILCLHGRFGRAETWSHFIQHYGTKYRIIAPDQRGHGFSSKPVCKYTTREMAEDIIEFIRYLKLDSVILAGHSMGGSIAAACVAAYPQYFRALAILDMTAAGPAEVSKLPLGQLPAKDPVTKDWPLPFASLSEAMDCISRTTDSEFSYQYFMNSLIETVEGYTMMFSSQAMVANAEYYVGWYDLLPKLLCPVLLISASSHQLISPEDFLRMQSMISDCIPRVMSHPDHNVQHSNREEFYEYFDELLAKA